MRVVVTGGAGFVGSNLCQKLVANGHEVICVDNLITGRRSNIAPLESHPPFRFVEADVIQPYEHLLGLTPEDKIDLVFHLASPASPVGYFRNPLLTMRVNSQGTDNSLAIAQRHGARFLISSTSEAYGDPLEHPQTEEYWGNVNPVGIRSPYDEGKRFGEALTMVYVREYGVNARIVRIFNTYGPNSDPEDGRFVPNFVTQALSGNPLTIYGSGAQTRSLLYVSDLVDGLIRAIEAPTDLARGRIYNIGNPEEHSILEFAQVIKRVADSSSEIVFGPPNSTDDPQRRRPDITRARSELGWEPRIGLEEGLRLTIDWMRAELRRQAK